MDKHKDVDIKKCEATKSEKEEKDTVTRTSIWRVFSFSGKKQVDEGEDYYMSW